MKFDRQPEADSEELVNLTSMIDVVFTLLAFFIITVRVFGVERDAVVGPAAEHGASGLVQGDLPERVTVSLAERPGSSDMRIFIGGFEFNDPAAITTQLREINLPQAQVVFAVSPGLLVEQVAAAVDAALQSPMKKVSLRQAEADELPGVSPAGVGS
jgi:biopolymer transport protein ExbD